MDSLWYNNPLYKTFESQYKLPDGWIELKTPKGKPYYACIATKHTQWLHPGIPVGTMMGNGLPYGWEKAFDEKTGREYYICHVGRFNTTSPPVKNRSYLGEEYVW